MQKVKLKNVTIPKDVRLICNSAFCGCASLTEVIFPNNILQISDNYFKECNRLKQITFIQTCTDENSNIPKSGRKHFLVAIVLLILIYYPMEFIR